MYKTPKTIGPEIYSIFWFLRKRSGNSLSITFCDDFWRKMVLMLCSINWPNFSACLLLLLEILANNCIAFVCYTGCNVLNFEINIFLIKAFFNMTKKWRQKFKYWEREVSFYSDRFSTWLKSEDKNLNILRTRSICLIEPLFYMTKKSRQKFKYLENEKSF